MRRPALLSLLLFLAALTAYLSNGRTIGAGDTLPAAYLPFSILREGTFSLDNFPVLHNSDATRLFPLLDGIPYYLLHRNGHYLSAYTPGPGVLAVPVYFLPILLGVDATGAWPGRLEKLSAAIITAGSVLFLYWALVRETSQGWAFVIALLYALGTSSLSVSSQGLWQHGPSQLFLSLGLYFLVKGRSDERYLGYAGFPLATAVVMRSTNLLLILPVAAWIVYAHRRRAVSLVLWALPPTLALAAYHLTYFGTADRGLGHTTAPVWALFTQMSLREGLPGVLIGPSRGLFVYSPVFLFSLAGIFIVWRRGPALWRALSLGLPLVVVAIAKWLTWWGGHGWGPRLLADIAPFMCFFLCPVIPLLDRRRLAKAAFVILALWSIGAHSLGAWLYDRRWDARATDETLVRLWPWTESPLAFYGRETLLRLVPSDGRQAQARQGRSPSGTLAASYEIGPVPAEVASGERFEVPLTAANTGSAAWPVAAPDDRGAVRLGWRWYRGDQEVAAGREFLLASVPPGGSAQFKARIVAPSQPGDYTLTLDLVSELIAWFGEGRQQPIRRVVRVLPRNIKGMLSEPIISTTPAPAARVDTDRASYRPGQAMTLDVVLDDPRRPRSYDAYLVLQQPDGQALFFDGHEMPRPGLGEWLPWVRGLPLPARASARFTVPLSALAPGNYRWHVVLTEPGAYRALARATAGFEIER